MRLRHFRKMVFDTHLKLVNKYGHEIHYESEYTTIAHKYDDCVVTKIQAIDYRILEVTLIRDRLPNQPRRTNRKEKKKND